MGARTSPQHCTSIEYSSVILGNKEKAAAPYVQHVYSHSCHAPVTRLLHNPEKLPH